MNAPVRLHVGMPALDGSTEWTSLDGHMLARVWPSDSPGFFWVEVSDFRTAWGLKRPISKDGIKLCLELVGFNPNNCRGWLPKPWSRTPPLRPVSQELPAPPPVEDSVPPEESVPADTEALVYFMQSEGVGGPIKIGFSINPERRKSEIQTMSAFPLRILATVPGGQAVESSLHRRFASTRMHGEWFQPSPELLAFIEEASR